MRIIYEVEKKVASGTHATISQRFYHIVSKKSSDGKWVWRVFDLSEFTYRPTNFQWIECLSGLVCLFPNKQTPILLGIYVFANSNQMHLSINASTHEHLPKGRTSVESKMPSKKIAKIFRRWKKNILGWKRDAARFDMHRLACQFERHCPENFSLTSHLSFSFSLSLPLRFMRFSYFISNHFSHAQFFFFLKNMCTIFVATKVI